MRALCLVVMSVWVLSTGARQAEWRLYQDAQLGLTFTYPPEFGMPARGTDDGFRDRVRAVRFADVGAEAVLTRGRVTVDHQAVGGLYDPIALQVLPDADATLVAAAATPLTASNFCATLASPDRTTRIALPARLLAAARLIDRMQAVSPRVDRCTVDADVVSFSRDAAVADTPGAARRHVSGAIRFLGNGAYSSFQIVAASSAAPPGWRLEAMRRVVQSMKLGGGGG